MASFSPFRHFLAEADNGARANISTAVVIAEVPTAWWDKWGTTRVHARGDDYEHIKRLFESKLTDLLLRRFPQLSGKASRPDTNGRSSQHASTLWHY
mgnify:CR=1 FL=1